MALVAERPEISLEILETLIIAFKNIQREKDDYSDNDNIYHFSMSERWSIETDRT
jgi:hypothetical protein